MNSPMTAAEARAGPRRGPPPRPQDLRPQRLLPRRGQPAHPAQGERRILSVPTQFPLALLWASAHATRRPAPEHRPPRAPPRRLRGARRSLAARPARALDRGRARRQPLLGAAQFERTWHADDRDWSFTRVALDGSSYVRLGPLLRWVTGSIGLHHVHHLNPGIPNYRPRGAASRARARRRPPSHPRRSPSLLHPRLLGWRRWAAGPCGAGRSRSWLAAPDEADHRRTT
ncbi:MAG: fatty acid desaturase [Nannocystis sp.]|nr:fatty acid desaturase [Nannocystis sp.]